MSKLAADKPRLEPRVRAMVRARLRDEAGERDMCIIDVSTRGLLATTARPPARGEFVEVQIGRNRLAAQVKWSGDRRFGMALRDRVSVAAMVEGGAGDVALGLSVGQRQVRGSTGAALLGNPQMLGRMFDFSLRVAAMCVIAWFAFDLVSQAFAPVREAMHAG